VACDFDKENLGNFVLITAQLGLLLLVADVFLIEENYGFSRLIPIIFVGFIIHAWLPFRFRAVFFLSLFFLAVGVFLGINGATLLVLIGLVLFAICHLPIRFMSRVAILLGMAAVLALIRVGLLELPFHRVQMYIQTQTLPILASMFMFRVAVYLYDLKHEKKPASLWERLCYFFLLPNVCFPLFPVIDYQTYRRTYYDKPALDIYQKGVDWIFRGIIHLMLYRIVYHYFVPNPLDIQNLTGVGQYMVSSFLLYLRISGLFHLIVGILCLFGLNLPETHHRYYLASTFNDFWRRINIYWKDFMMKMFYYPVFMKLRGWGTTRAMVVATLFTFFCTWLLHSYQWFWLRGSFPLHPQDAIFWGTLAVLVTINSLYEAKRGRRRRSLSGQQTTLRDAVMRSLQTVGMFVFMCILWSFWTSTTVSEWLSVVSVAADATAGEVAQIIFILAGAVVIGTIAQLAITREWIPSYPSPSIFRSASLVGGCAVVFLLVSMPAVHGQLGADATQIVSTIKGDQLNARDREQMVRGYYEDLLGTEGWGSMLWSIRLEEPDMWRWDGQPTSNFIRQTGNLRFQEFKPLIETIHKGNSFKTNRWGMRDKEYDKKRPPQTYRIAVLGSSYAVGSGVDVEETFPSLLEQYLNEENLNEQYTAYEVLNFALGDESVLRRLTTLSLKAIEFQPHAILDMGTTNEISQAIQNLRETIQSQLPNLEPYLEEIIGRAKIKPDMSAEEIERRLKPFGEELVRWAYQHMAEISRQHGIKLICFVLPLTDESDSAYRKSYKRLSRIAREVGIIVVDLSSVYGDLNKRDSLKLSPWDWHPNAKGHAMIGNRLYEELKEGRHL